MNTVRTLADVRALEQQPIDAIDLPPDVYAGLERAAARHPERIAWHALWTGTAEETPRSATFAENFAAVTRSANLLAELGVGPADAVTLMMPILPETSILMWGAGTAGIANPVNGFLGLDYLEAIMRAARTKVLVGCHPRIDPVGWPKIETLRARLPGVRVIQAGSDGAPTSDDVVDLEPALAAQPADRLVCARSIRPDDVVAYFHTGGTTGLPKLAQHTHRGHLLHAWCLARFDGGDPAEQLGMVGVPLFHVGGAVAGGLYHLLTGRTLVYLHPNGFREPVVIRDFLRNAERFGATSLGAVPAVWSALLNLDAGGVDLARVRNGLVGGAPLSVEVAAAVERKFGFPLIEGWGMTEAHCFGTLTPLAGEHRTGSVGIRFPYLDVRVVACDAERRVVRECSTDEPGLLVLRGPQVTPGYVDPEHDRRARVQWGEAGEWFDTGDLARIDAEGYVWLTGRAKDLIIRGGHNIDPALVEDVLYAHPGVELAAAVGQPDRRVGEVPCAYVQMKPGATFDEAELRDFLRERIQERAALPAAITAVAAMPLTPVGKIYKPALRDAAAERVLRSELAALCAPGERVDVTVAPHPSFGSLARVAVTAAEPERRAALEARCRAALGAYALRFEI